MSFDAYFSVFPFNASYDAKEELEKILPKWFAGYNDVSYKPNYCISGGWSLYSQSFKEGENIIVKEVKEWCKRSGAFALIRFTSDAEHEKYHIVGTSPVIITRHEGLVELLKEEGLIPSKCKVLSHVEDPEQIKSRWVIGILPVHLAVHTAIFSCPELELPLELRGKELSKDEMRPYFKGLKHYFVGGF